MRFGTWRGVTLAVALAALAASGSARGDGLFDHTIPKEVDAIDLNTGGPYYAPPIPYGHYAKEGVLSKCCGKLMGLGHGLGHGCHACRACGGKGCGLCGGKGTICGGDEGGSGHGHGHGWGHGAGDPGCGDPGCGGHHGLGMGHGLGHGKRFENCGLCGGKGCEICTSTILPSSQAAPGRATTAPQAVATAQAATAASAQACGLSGCGFKGLHKHHGRGTCAHDPGLACDACSGDPGHGFGHGHGGGCFHGPGATCGNCRGNGKGKGCGFCGGKGCRNCLGKLKGSLYGLLHPHAGEIEYFVGPGGPVPLTPGYVQWVNPVRAPRDFFAFPPFTQ